MPENIYKHRDRAYLNCMGTRVAPLFCDPDIPTGIENFVAAANRKPCGPPEDELAPSDATRTGTIVSSRVVMNLLAAFVFFS